MAGEVASTPLKWSVGLDQDQNGVITESEIERLPSFIRDRWQQQGLDFSKGVRVEDLQQNAQRGMEEMRRQREEGGAVAQLILNAPIDRSLRLKIRQQMAAPAAVQVRPQENHPLRGLEINRPLRSRLAVASRRCYRAPFKRSTPTSMGRSHSTNGERENADRSPNSHNTIWTGMDF